MVESGRHQAIDAKIARPQSTPAPGWPGFYRPKLAWALILTVLLSACALPRADVGPEGRLEIFGPASALNAQRVPKDWTLDGPSPTEFLLANIRVVNDGGERELRLWPGDQPYVLARRIRALLLASPFLSWSWNLADYTGTGHPIGLTVGFFGGNPKFASAGGHPFVFTGQKLPPHDRVLTVAWGAKALQRGSLEGNRPVPRYIARGGRENSEKWWTETLDLSDLYARLWPKDEIGRVKITFIGFASAATENRAGARFKNLILSK